MPSATGGSALRALQRIGFGESGVRSRLKSVEKKIARAISNHQKVMVLFDYRSVLSEVLTRVLGHRDINQVFPNFHPEPVGLVG